MHAPSVAFWSMHYLTNMFWYRNSVWEYFSKHNMRHEHAMIFHKLSVDNYALLLCLSILQIIVPIIYIHTYISYIVSRRRVTQSRLRTLTTWGRGWLLGLGGCSGKVGWQGLVSISPCSHRSIRLVSNETDIALWRRSNIGVICRAVVLGRCAVSVLIVLCSCLQGYVTQTQKLVLESLSTCLLLMQLLLKQLL